MRTLAAVFVLLAAALPAAAGPIDSWQYRTSLRTDQAPGAGPVSWPGETAYQLGHAPEFGVVTSSVPDWEQASPAYPSANFALVHPGTFTPFITAGGPLFPEVSGGGRYFLDLEIRDAEGRVGVASFSGDFSAGWWGEHGSAWPIFDTIPTPDGAGIPVQPIYPSGAIWLGRTRYDVRLDYGFGGPYYMQDADGNWFSGWFAADPVPFQNGGYWSEYSGSFYAEITPTATPEPGTLALAGIGLCGVLAARRAGRGC
jgi:hypothetical protein